MNTNSNNIVLDYNPILKSLDEMIEQGIVAGLNLFADAAEADPKSAWRVIELYVESDGNNPVHRHIDPQKYRCYIGTVSELADDSEWGKAARRCRNALKCQAFDLPPESTPQGLSRCFEVAQALKSLIDVKYHRNELVNLLQTAREMTAHCRRSKAAEILASVTRDIPC